MKTLLNQVGDALWGKRPDFDRTAPEVPMLVRECIAYLRQHGSFDFLLS